MTNLKGKRLLILGATGFMCSAIETAREMGIYTIVTDYTPGAIAKQFADKSYDISTTDIDALEQLARNERIDGVFTGFSDVNLYSARELCDRLGLPFYATKEQLDTTTNKLKFKELCRKHGVPTVKQYELDGRCLPEHLVKIQYPVIVKPADSYASKGCSVCKNEEELCTAVRHALAFSKSGQFVVEKYMSRENSTDHHFDYLFVNGVPHLSFVSQRFTTTVVEGAAPFGTGIFTPVSYAEEYIRDVDSQAKQMFSSLNIKCGKLGIQACHDDEGFHFYEMAFRLGAMIHVPLREEYGLDLTAEMIRFALTGIWGVTLPIESSCLPYYKHHYCELNVLLHSEGTISRIEGIETACRDVRTVQLVELKRIGDTITLDGTQGQILCRMLLKEQTREALEQAVSEIAGRIEAYDEHERPMVMRIYGCEGA